MLSTWVASVSFKRCMWRYPVDVTGLPSYPYMQHRVFFYLEWHVAAQGGRIFVGGHLIFFLLFSLPTGNVHNYPLCFLLFNFSPYSINFLFRSFSIYRIFILFNLVLQLQFLICLVFHFSPHFLKFLILSFVRLLKVFCSFNFII